VNTDVLDPRDTYADPSEWDRKAKDLAQRFVKNFTKFSGEEEGKRLVNAGPHID
jgi:phosphoenolpyruvate carboxykinase (ATP)